MEKRTVVVTGGNSGLGYQCAKNIALKSKEYTVVLACRNKRKAETSIKSMRNETGNTNIYSLELDLASLQSVRNFYSAFCAEKYPPLYSLVCNAGFNHLGEIEYTKDGFEATFGVCHLGHFLLANLMLKQISDNGRIIIVSSDMHSPPKVMSRTVPAFTDVHSLAYPEAGSAAMMYYPMAKLCNILCAYEMSARLTAETDKRITVNAFNPGLMTDTNFMSPNINRVARAIISGFMTLFGAAIGKLGSGVKSGKALAELITEQRYEGSTGKYYDRGKDIQSSEPSYDKEAAKKLWVESSELVKLQQSETILSVAY